MLPQLVAAALGIGLMASPAALGDGDAASTVAYVAGPLAASVGFVAHVPVPGVDTDALSQVIASQGFL